IQIFDCDGPRVHFIIESLDVSEVTRLQRDGVWIIADRDRIEDDDHEQNRDKRDRADHPFLRSNYLFRLSGSHPRKPADEAALVEPIEDPRATGDDPDEMPQIDLALPIVLDIDRGSIQQLHLILIVGEIALDVDICTRPRDRAAGLDAQLNVRVPMAGPTRLEKDPERVGLAHFKPHRARRESVADPYAQPGRHRPRLPGIEEALVR